jgi:hypothetical protein
MGHYRGHRCYVHRGHIVPETLPPWMREEDYQEAVRPVRKSAGQHWVTIGGHAEDGKQHADGHRVLLDGEGRIIGGSVPRAFQGLRPSDLRDRGRMRREWQQVQSEIRATRGRIAKMEAGIPRLARELEAEDDAARRHLLDEIKQATEGQMIAPDETEENRELPSYYKRRGHGKQRNPWSLDAVADAMGLTENALHRRIMDAEWDRRNAKSPEAYRAEAERLILGDEAYEAEVEYLRSLEESIGAWRGPGKKRRPKQKARPATKPAMAKSLRTSHPDPARRLVLTNGVEGGSEMQSSRRIRRAGAGHQGGALVLWSRRRMRRSNQSPLPATEDRYTQAGAVWPPSEPIEEQEPLAIRRRYADGGTRRLNPQAEQAELAKRSGRLDRAIGISILESRTARATRGRDPRGRYLHHGRMRKSARLVILGRDGRRRPGGAVRARSTRPGPEEHASRRWPRKNLVLGRYRHGTDRQAREQGSGWRRDQESSAQVLGALTASRRSHMPGTSPIPRPSGKPAVVALKSRSMEDTARALAAYRRLLHSSSSPAAALQRLAQGYDPDGSGKPVGGAWVLDAETGKGRVFWRQAQRSGLPVPAAYQEVLHRDDVDARDVFWSEQPAFGSMKGGFLHR